MAGCHRTTVRDNSVYRDAIHIPTLIYIYLIGEGVGDCHYVTSPPLYFLSIRWGTSSFRPFNFFP